MKRHLSTVVGTYLGLCAAFALCYICVVLPHRGARMTASAPQQIRPQDKITITVALRIHSRADYKRIIDVLDVAQAAAVKVVAVATATTE